MVPKITAGPTVAPLSSPRDVLGVGTILGSEAIVSQDIGVKIKVSEMSCAFFWLDTLLLHTYPD